MLGNDTNVIYGSYGLLITLSLYSGIVRISAAAAMAKFVFSLSMRSRSLSRGSSWILLKFLLILLAHGRFGLNCRWVNLMLISVIDGWGIYRQIALIWMVLDLTDDKSTLVQVMAWCRQATSHYLSQHWPEFMSSYCITRPLWVMLWSIILIVFCHINMMIWNNWLPKKFWRKSWMCNLRMLYVTRQKELWVVNLFIQLLSASDLRTCL